MKKSDLYKEWARVLDMCEGTVVSPNECWKFDGSISDTKPVFIHSPEHYEFAVAILEGKPVFVGDRLYFPHGTPLIIKCNELRETMSVLSWNPPKKTFMLNGVELPRPTDNADDGYMIFFPNSGTKYYFNSLQDRNKFADAIISIIEGALK